MKRARASLRTQIALEAARLLWAGVESDMARARERAARRVLRGAPGSRVLPSAAEVAGYLQSWAAMAAVPATLQHSRELELSALWIMRSLRRFRPRLVRNGTLHPDRHSRIELEADPDSDGYLELALESLESAGLEPSRRPGGRITLGGRHRFSLSFRPARRPGVSAPSNRIDEAGLANQLREQCPWLALDEELATGEGCDPTFALRQLLEALDDVKLDPRTHPEGSALYHCLQVFDRISRQYPYDDDLLAAALLHLVGKSIDPSRHAEAAAEALTGIASERTREMIGLLPDACADLAGNLGERGRRRLREHPDAQELRALAAADLRGREIGVEVSELDEALAYLAELASYEED